VRNSFILISGWETVVENCNSFISNENVKTGISIFTSLRIDLNIFGRASGSDREILGKFKLPYPFIKGPCSDGIQCK
jgi:hypothetical protein